MSCTKWKDARLGWLLTVLQPLSLQGEGTNSCSEHTTLPEALGEVRMLPQGAMTNKQTNRKRYGMTQNSASMEMHSQSHALL